MFIRRIRQLFVICIALIQTVLAHDFGALEPISIEPIPMHRGIMRGKCPVSSSVLQVQSDGKGAPHVPFVTSDERAGFHICFSSQQRKEYGYKLFGGSPKEGSVNEGYLLHIGWGKTDRFFQRKDVVENMIYGDGAMFTFKLLRDDNNQAGYDSTMITFEVSGEFLITAIDSNGDFISPTYILPPNLHMNGGGHMGRYLISLENIAAVEE